MTLHSVLWILDEHAEGADKASHLQNAKALQPSCAQVLPGICALRGHGRARCGLNPG
jgi:hypothetical protein